MRSLLVPIFLLLVSAVAYSQVIKPQYAVVQAKNERIEALEEAVTQAFEIQRRRDELLAQLNQVPGEQRTLVKNAVPVYSHTSVAQFFIDLEQVIRVSGLPQETSFTTGSENRSSTSVVTIPVTVNTTVSFNGARNFLRNLQRWNRGIRIKRITMRARGDTGGAARNSVSFTVSLEAPFSTQL